jgi:hypothetical protein
MLYVSCTVWWQRQCMLTCAVRHEVPAASAFLLPRVLVSAHEPTRLPRENVLHPSVLRLWLECNCSAVSVGDRTCDMRRLRVEQADEVEREANL